MFGWVWIYGAEPRITTILLVLFYWKEICVTYNFLSSLFLASKTRLRELPILHGYLLTKDRIQLWFSCRYFSLYWSQFCFFGSSSSMLLRHPYWKVLLTQVFWTFFVVWSEENRFDTHFNELDGYQQSHGWCPISHQWVVTKKVDQK